MQQEVSAKRGQEGGAMRGQQEAMQQPASATRQQEDGAMRGQGEAMQQPAGTQDDKRAVQQEAIQPGSLPGPNGIN